MEAGGNFKIPLFLESQCSKLRPVTLYIFMPVTSPAFIFCVTALHLPFGGVCTNLLPCFPLQSELGNFARSSTLLRQSFNPKFQTMFQPCNLKGALQLIEDFHAQVQVDWSPRKTVKKSGTYLKGEEVRKCSPGDFFHAVRPPDERWLSVLFGMIPPAP